MRYLAELVWNPDAILFNHDLEWRVLDQRRLQVAAGNGPRRVEVCLVLNDDGDPASMEAGARPRLVGRTFAMTPWFGRCHDYQWLGGRRVPCRAEAGWDLDGKPFVYWKAQCETWSVA
jgi:hypothetical protein